MRTPKLTEDQKQHAVYAIENDLNTVTEMANYFNCHPATIYRALREAGADTAPSGRKPSAGQKALEILKKHGISVEQLDTVLSRVVTYQGAPAAPARITSKPVPALFYPAGAVI